MPKPAAFPKSFRAHLEPSPDLIRECEVLLERAKAGDLRALAVAIVYRDDVCPAGEVNRAWVTTPGTAWALDTAINRLVHKWRKHEYDGDAQQPVQLGG
jgi:hypothetical protein